MASMFSDARAQGAVPSRTAAPPTPQRRPTRLAGVPAVAADSTGDNTSVQSGIDLAYATMQSMQASSRNKAQANEVQRPYSRQDLERQMTRRWKVGDIYAPHDLTGVEMAKWKKLRRRGRAGLKYDVVDQLAINPIDHYKNFSMMSEYVSEMGRIKHGNETALRPVNQRRMAKAIRRAIGCGLMPGVYRHPELLRIEMQRRGHRM